MTDRLFQDEEPSAGYREMAKNFREIFVALVHEGFTEQQALGIMADLMRSAFEANR